MIGKSCSIFVLLLITTTVYGKPPERIYNGKICRQGEYPFIVSLNINGAHQCGGSIIGERHILTAAHCVSHLTVKERDEMIIRSHTIYSKSGGYEYRAQKIWYHYKYNSQDISSPHDIAVIRLTEIVQFDDKQKWIALASKPTGTGVHATAVGWGYTETNRNSVSYILKKLSLNTLDFSRCQNYLQDKLWQGQICGAGPKGQGVCMGDSGGPLINDNYELIGIVSWGIPCARGNPDVFTSVYQYRDWIMNVITQP